MSVIARSADRFQETVAEIASMDRKGIAISVDLSLRKPIFTFIETVKSCNTRGDILVNNARIGSGTNPKLIVNKVDDF